MLLPIPRLTVARAVTRLAAATAHSELTPRNIPFVLLTEYPRAPVLQVTLVSLPLLLDSEIQRCSKFSPIPQERSDDHIAVSALDVGQCLQPMQRGPPVCASARFQSRDETRPVVPADGRMLFYVLHNRCQGLKLVYHQLHKWRDLRLAGLFVDRAFYPEVDTARGDGNDVLAMETEVRASSLYLLEIEDNEFTERQSS